MGFEKAVSLAEIAGQKVGLFAGALLFVMIAFFVIGKAGVLCWSWTNFAKFAGSILSVYVIIEVIRRLSGKNANQIVS